MMFSTIFLARQQSMQELKCTLVTFAAMLRQEYSNATQGQPGSSTREAGENLFRAAQQHGF
jgi:hypothetical protein